MIISSFYLENDVRLSSMDQNCLEWEKILGISLEFENLNFKNARELLDCLKSKGIYINSTWVQDLLTRSF